MGDNRRHKCIWENQREPCQLALPYRMRSGRCFRGKTKEVGGGGEAKLGIFFVIVFEQEME
jgi:hypothetical protein